MVYNWASGVPTFIWELINDTSSDEGDGFGILHGMMYKPRDFRPRPVFQSMQNTNAIFADTTRDASIRVSISNKGELERAANAPFFAYAFRSLAGKIIVAYWLGAHSWPGGNFVPYYTTMKLENTGIVHPVLVNILSGKISRLRWASGASESLAKLPVLDTVLVVADASYFDWPVLPQAPSSLRAVLSGSSVKLTWVIHGQDVTHIAMEKQLGYSGRWERVTTLPATAMEYEDTQRQTEITSYRVRALNDAGESAYSNVVSVRFH
jgi:hypothetical protein